MYLFIIAAAVLFAAGMALAQTEPVKSCEKTPGGVTLLTDKGVIRLAVYNQNAVRVTYGAGKTLPEIKSLSVIAKPATAGYKVSEADDNVVLETKAVRVLANRKTGVVSFYEGSKLLCSEAPGGRVLKPAVIEGQNVLSVTQKFTVRDNEVFYGLGQDQTGVTNRAGRITNLQQGNQDKTVPVLVSNRGYGILWDNPSYGQVDLKAVKSTAATDDEVIPSSALIAADGTKGGLTGEYFSGGDFADLVETRKDAAIDFDWTKNPPALLPHDHYSVRWTGQIVAPATGTYQIVTSADDGVRLWLDGKLVIDDWNAAAVRRNSAKIKLTAGQKCSVKLEFFQDQFDSEVQLRWAVPGKKPVDLNSDGKPVTASIYAEVAKGIDYYFLAGQKMDDVISGYRQLTGDAPLYGKWFYGYWQCKERYKSAAELLEAAEGFRSRQIPIDNLIQDWMYWHDPWGCHDFDKTRYPDPAGLIKELHEKYKLHVMISVWPKFVKGSSNYDAMDSQGFLYPEYKWFGDLIQRYYDPFNPKARELFWGQVQKNLFSLGIDAWWLDGDEPEVGFPVVPVNGVDYGLPTVFHTYKTALGPGANVLNAYPLMHTQTFYEGQRKATDQKRVFLLSRCVWAGMQRNAATCWSGDIPRDWDALRKQVPGGLNMMMSGIPYWNTDIGGFWGGVDGGNPESPAYRELFLRWIQYGTFCPMMRVHGEHPNKEPWRFGPDGQKVITKYINLRYRLMPYIYSTAWKITSDHYTMMRPLVMDFTSDRTACAVDNQFMFGPALMVSPVTQKGAASREVYLPAGTNWIDFWTGKTVNGAQTVDSPAPVDVVPLYVRAGSIVPMGPFVQYVAEKPADPIEIRVYPGANGKFTLYEDEGDTYNYEKGQYSTIPMSWDDKAKVLTIGSRNGSFSGMLKDRTFRVVLVSAGRGRGVEIENEPDQAVKYAGAAVKVKLAK